MRLLERLSPLLEPKIHPEAQGQIDAALEVLRDLPDVVQIRLFGSAQRKRHWHPERSDIDIFVLMKASDRWSFFTQERMCSYWDEDGQILPIYGETRERRELERKVRNVAKRVELHIATEDDFKVFEEEGGIRYDALAQAALGKKVSLGMHERIMEGKLLFERSNRS
jgi:predicted nucleotidyltransferase